MRGNKFLVKKKKKKKEKKEEEKKGAKEAELTQVHRIEPAVDVQDEIHFEGLGLAVQPAH